MSLKSGWIEKRWHERKAASWEVTYQVIGSEEAAVLCREYRTSTQSFSQREGQADSHAIVHDLSVNGLAVIGPQSLASGTKLLLYVHHPSHLSSLVVVAEVVHSVAQSREAGSFYRSGMKILGVDENSFHRVLQVL